MKAWCNLAAIAVGSSSAPNLIGVLRPETPFNSGSAVPDVMVVGPWASALGTRCVGSGRFEQLLYSRVGEPEDGSDIA